MGKKERSNMLNYIAKVFKRELGIMLGRPIYLYGTVLVLAFCAIFLLTLMNQGQPVRVPIGIVDLDNSYLSRSTYNQLNSLQGVEVINKYTNYQEAREGIQRGEIYGFMLIERDTYKKAVNGERPIITCYYTEAFMVPGTFAYKNFLTISNVVNAGVKRSVLRARGTSELDIATQIQPISVEIHGIGNPWTSYAIYLISVLWPGILALCIVVMSVFTIGFELKTKTCREWLRCGGGSIINSLIGKLLPYFIIYMIMGVAFEVLVYKIIGYPLMGPFWVMLINITMLILASFGVGIFFIGLFPVLRDALSGASLYSVLAISMSGMTVPVENMLPALQGVAQMFPIRQYYLIYVKWGVLGSGIGDCWLNMIGMCIFFFVPFMVLLRLKKALIYCNYPTK